LGGNGGGAAVIVAPNDGKVTGKPSSHGKACGNNMMNECCGGSWSDGQREPGIMAPVSMLDLVCEGAKRLNGCVEGGR